MLEELASASDKVGLDTNALGSPPKLKSITPAMVLRFEFFFFRIRKPTYIGAVPDDKSASRYHRKNMKA